ncbi:hypothetical protein [Gilvimarinus chinensis]|uniref:hypothetical protein n=1 Tax=Gilvimarinus chinensis TaxID=396005 RepID=UPI0012FBD805|nr:hypothetical protein [Gilvimarinus chinensis]
MVYLGPITHLTPVTKPKPATGYEPDRDLVITKRLPDAPPGFVERRKGDRRKSDRSTRFDSRSGSDRRRSNRPTIDIEV